MRISSMDNVIRFDPRRKFWRRPRGMEDEEVFLEEGIKPFPYC
jgi:hypothetical protein